MKPGESRRVAGGLFLVTIFKPGISILVCRLNQARAEETALFVGIPQLRIIPCSYRRTAITLLPIRTVIETLSARKSSLNGHVVTSIKSIYIYFITLCQFRQVFNTFLLFSLNHNLLYIHALIDKNIFVL